MRKLVTLALLTLGLAVAACNTVEGAGRDIQSAGHAISDTARDASR
jgi:entericidin B